VSYPLTRPVHIPTVLDPMNHNNLLVVNDLVDDPVVTAPRRIEPSEFADQPLAEPMRILGNRPQDGLHGGMAYLAGKPVEMAKTLGCDLDLVHPSALRRYPGG